MAGTMNRAASTANTAADNGEDLEKLNMEVICQLQQDLLTGSTGSLNFENPKKTASMRAMLYHFFDHLEARLPKQEFTFLNLLPYGIEDFSLYGDRLVEFERKAKELLALDDQKLATHQELLQKYLELVPKDLQTLRLKLCQIRAAQLQEIVPLIKWDIDNCPIDYTMVTYRPVNPGFLSGNASSQLQQFIKEIRLSDQARDNLIGIIAMLNEALQTSELAEFGPKLLSFGSLETGLATFSSDLDLVIKFENINVDLIDFETSLLALQVIRPILNKKLGLEISERHIFPSRRCPIISLRFFHCLPKDIIYQKETGGLLKGLKFNQCDISIRSLYSYYNSKLVGFLAMYDHRFYEMAMVLKYWAKKSCLISPELISTFGLYMMIAYVLQKTSPPILPTIERLQRMARQQPGKEPIRVHKYSFEFCDDVEILGKSSNTQTTPELLIEFINFYHNFDYRTFAVSPRLGTLLNKLELYERNRNLSDISSQFKRTYIAVEDPFVTDNNCGGVYKSNVMNKWCDAFSEVRFGIRCNPKNVVQLLTNPKNINHFSQDDD